MHICFSVSRKLALKIMLKVNLSQCDGFVFHSNIRFFNIAQFFFYSIPGKQMSVILTLKVVLIYTFTEKMLQSSKMLFLIR